MWRCEDVKMRRCEDERMWRWEDVKMRGCEDEKMWRWEDVKMRRCENERMWRWEDVKIRRCEDEKMWRWEDVKMRGCEDEKMWRCFTDPHYWKNPALRRSREKIKTYRFQWCHVNDLKAEPTALSYCTIDMWKVYSWFTCVCVCVTVLLLHSFDFCHQCRTADSCRNFTQSWSQQAIVSSQHYRFGKEKN